jgi:hypothetical protein
MDESRIPAIHRYHPCIWAFRCPTCRARVGEQCVGGVTHKRRINLGDGRPPKPIKGDVGSVRDIPGGAFEMNRRRH